MPLHPAHKAELEQRKTDALRRITALEAVHDNIHVPDQDPPPGLVAGLSSIWSDLQQLRGDTQTIHVPDLDPPSVVVGELQGAESTLHDIETRLLDPASSTT